MGKSEIQQVFYYCKVLSFTCFQTRKAGSVLETDTLCGNVREPFWFAPRRDVMTGSIGQGSQAAAPQLALFGAKRSTLLQVESL